jgi:hypothetical protein
MTSFPVGRPAIVHSKMRLFAACATKITGSRALLKRCGHLRFSAPRRPPILESNQEGEMPVLKPRSARENTVMW